MIDVIRKRIVQSEFARNIFYLVGATAFAQLIPFLLLPVLQRYFFSPVAFGVLTIYIASSDLIVSVSSFKYEYAIVLEDRLKNAVNLLLLSILCVLTVSILCFVFFFIAFLVGFKNSITETLHGFLFLIPVSVAAYGTFDCLNYWFNRNKGYIQLGVGKISTSFGSESVKLITGFAGQISFGLILGRVAGQLVGLITMIIIFLKKFRRVLRLLSLKEALLLARKHKNLPFFTTPSILLGVLINFLYVQMFLSYYGSEKIGIMGVSISYVSAAFSMLSVSFSQVFYGKITAVKDNKILQKLFTRYALMLFAFSGMIVLIIYSIPNKWILLLLGEKWNGMLKVMRIMVLWIAVSFVISSLSFIYIRLGRQREMFLMDLVHLVMIVTVIYFAHHLYGDFYFTLNCFTAVQIIYYFAALTAAFIFIKKSN